jgi:hypothetical protein
MNKMQRELRKIRKTYAVIARHTSKLVRLGTDQDSTVQLVAGELQRQATILDKLGEQMTAQVQSETATRPY